MISSMALYPRTDAAYYLEGRPESRFIRKPYKEKLARAVLAGRLLQTGSHKDTYQLDYYS
jgi:hypothetical protein